MLAVIIIAVSITAISASIYWGATKGKMARLTDAMMSQSAGAKAALYTLFVVTYLGFGLVIPIVFLINNHDRAKTDISHVTLTAAEVNGRQLFGEHCAVCHTLAAASAVGKTGPNLDELKPSAGLVENTIYNGCLADPGPTQQQQECLGEGSMPADTVQGQDATDVANFVAKVAGHS